jgi:hypothetical protein
VENNDSIASRKRRGGKLDLLFTSFYFLEL